MSFFGGHWYPCFGFLVTSLDFKAREGSALFALGGQCAAGHFPTCMCRGGTWLGFERAITRTDLIYFYICVTFSFTDGTQPRLSCCAVRYISWLIPTSVVVPAVLRYSSLPEPSTSSVLPSGLFSAPDHYPQNMPRLNK